MTLTNFNLMDIASSYKIKKDFYVIMNDELQYFPFKTGYYIINLDDSDKSGSHWVCLIIEENKCLYWDSFGCLPSLDVIQFMKKSRTKYMYSNRIVQHLESTNCGLFALGVIIYVLKTKGDLYDAVDQYTDLFSMEPIKNDKIILDLFKSKFRNI